MDDRDDLRDDETFAGEPAPLDPRAARLLASAAAPRALPADLRARLLALPEAAESEDEEVRRYERARAAGLAAAATGRPPLFEPAPAARPARTERAIASWIAAARRPAALPQALRARLVGIGRAARRPLPFWLVDVRYATAACLLLTLLSTLAAEDASALLGQRAAAADAQRQEWQVQLTETAREGAEDAVAATRRLYFRGQKILLSRVEAVRDLFEEKLRQFNQTELGRRLSGERAQREGISDGQP